MGLGNLIFIVAIFFMAINPVDSFAGASEAFDYYTNGNYEAALNELKPLLEKDDSDAQNLMGVMYLTGRGVPKNENLGLQYYLKAANQGHSTAQKNLGHKYLNGFGVAINHKEAFGWFEKSAVQGDVGSMFELGKLYRDGLGVTKNLNKAFELFKKAAENDNTDAMFNLALAYEKGHGTEVNNKEAADWYLSAALRGDVAAQNNIGSFYYNGSGVTKDTVRAMCWFIISSSGGNQLASKNLDIAKSNAVATDINAAVRASSVFRVRPVSMTKEKAANWLESYRASYKKAKTKEDFSAFIVGYENDDPDKLVPSVWDKLKSARAQEQIRLEAETKKKTQLFRKKLKAGDDTHCGLVVEVKKPVARIQTMIGEHWLKVDQLYPPNQASCSFRNGVYQEP